MLKESLNLNGKHWYLQEDGRTGEMLSIPLLDWFRMSEVEKTHFSYQVREMLVSGDERE